jgi:hypothetical protein
MADTTDYLNSKTCPACNGKKHPGIILCLDCWGKVRGATKEVLLKADVFAIGRREWFYNMLASGWSLEEITLPENSPDYKREAIKHRRTAPGQEDFKFMASVPTRIRRRGRR